MKDALARYSKIVKQNIEYINNLQMEKYVDPDCLLEPVNVGGISISLATDGLCGIKRIIQYSSKDNIGENYKLIRKRYFVWPAYAMSINQQRGFKNTFDDRIDLLMIDLEKMFAILEENRYIYSLKMVEQIQKECRLYRAYLNMFTLIWLSQFKTFDGFISENKYWRFVDKVGDKYVAVKWTESEVFDEKYFSELLNRLKQ